MNPFWRKVPLSNDERTLLDHLFEAHRKATFRQNASSEVIKAAYMMNGHDFIKAVASGLGTVGGLHAPIEEVYELLDGFAPNLIRYEYYVLHGKKMPGWGNSFITGKPDPIVESVMLYIDTGWPEIGKRIEYLTDILHGQGKHIYPNMACATAATAIILGMPKELSPVLLLHGRSLAWAEIIHDSQRQPPAEKVRNNGEGV